MSTATKMVADQIKEQRMAKLKSLLPRVNVRLRSIRKTYGANSEVYKTYTRHYEKVFGANGRDVLTKTGNVSFRKLQKVYEKGLPGTDYAIMERNLSRIPTVSEIRQEAMEFAGLDEKTIKGMLRNPKKLSDDKTIDEFVTEKLQFENQWGSVKDQFYDIEVMLNEVELGASRRGSRNAKVEFYDDTTLNDTQKQQVADMRGRLSKLQSDLDYLGDNTNEGYNKLKKTREEMARFNKEFMALRNSIRK